MRGKVGTNATGDSMGLKENVQEPGETNVNEVNNDQHGTAPAQIHVLPGNQDDKSTLTSIGNFNSSESETPYKGHPRENLLKSTSHPLKNTQLI